MNIAIVSHARFPIAEPFAGGLEAHTHFLATALVRRGHAVTVYGAPGSGPGYSVKSYDNTCHSIAEELPREAAIAQTYQRMMDDVAAGGYDLVHNNSLNHVAMIRCAQLDIPTVQVLHSPLLEKCAASADLIKQHTTPTLIAVSSVTQRNWQAAFDVQHVVPNGIDLLRWRYSSRPVPGLVVYAGRIVPEKGVHLAVEAAKLADKQLMIAGPISDPDYYRDFIEPQLDERRRYVGHLTMQETAHLMSNAESFAFTSVWDEPFGLVLAESLACGTPVAGFDVGAAREVLDDDTGVLVPMGDVVALAGAMRQAAALKRPDCRRRAMQEFSVDTMVDRYEQVYRLAARKQPVPQRPRVVMPLPVEYLSGSFGRAA